MGRSKTEVTREVTVVNKLGIHARPASMFVRLAAQFDSEVTVEKDGEAVNGKSIMNLMLLAAGPGSRIRLSAAGPDAQQAVDELENLVKSKFNEE